LRVLIVDDDEMVRFVCAGMLEVLHHDAMVAESAEDAIQILQHESGRFDLILLDDIMPEMCGRELISKLFRLGYRIPVVICSGKSITPNDFVDSSDCQPLAVLTKPFTLQRLKAVLELVPPGTME
jgi:CheY-like chemotaxis protein